LPISSFLAGVSGKLFGQRLKMEDPKPNKKIGRTNNQSMC